MVYELLYTQKVYSMVTYKKKKGSIAILTGGGDVPGLNPAIRAITIRALREGYQVIGLKKRMGRYYGIGCGIKKPTTVINIWYLRKRL